MSISSLDHASGSLSQPSHDGLFGFRPQLHRLAAAFGPYGRRYVLTGMGAVLALGLGAATASAVRLPADLTDPATPDQTTTLDELPAAAAARAFALGNPPTLAIAEPKEPQIELARIDPVITAEETQSLASPANDDEAQRDTGSDKYPPVASTTAHADNDDTGH